MGGFGLGASRSARRRLGSRAPTPTAAPGILPSAFAAAPSVHYHFNSQAVSVDGLSRLASCPDIRGLAQLLAVSGTTAPTLMTDGLGRKFLRFNGNEAAAIANALSIASNRSFMALMVGRVHHSGNTQFLLSPRFAAYTDPANNTVANLAISYIKAFNVSNSAPFLQAAAPEGSTNATDCYKIIPGCQMQVMAIASRATANGGTRIYMNNDTCDTAQQQTAVTNYIGGVVGGTGSASNSEALGNTANTFFDLYELAIWSTGPLNAVSDVAVEAAVANFAIPQLDTNLVLEGDSITYGVATALAESPANSKGLGSRLTEPGAELVPGNVRVLNRGSSGSKIANLLTRRDAASSPFASGKYPGGPSKNLVAVQIGRNDFADTPTTAAIHYANVVAYLNTDTTGILQRGWSVVQVGNVATSATNMAGAPDAPITIQGRIEQFRSMIITGTAINPTFANDTQSAPGQAFDGLVSVLPAHLITVAGDTAFGTAADSADTTAGYYDNGQTHLRVAGVDLMASGGDDPAHGYGSIR